MSVLAEQYKEEIVPKLMDKFDYENIMAVPRVEKVVVNVGMGELKEDPKLIDVVVNDIASITGQKPVITRAKKSVANFKIREGMPIGAKVTLRGETMYEFLYKLVNVTLPRIRDFRGVSPKSFDGRGNYNIGIREHIVFPEIEIDKVDKVYGLEITIVTSAETDEEAYELLKLMGMPFNQ
ncbi:50S ribosomal protein L5 [Halothermothrix orenii]|uniref:Large ribosomal subunit protein uL5 n=1 Tax=Halothermothrix orenii (strain H 168 / OCM 544 / DSM 9562) TaxID=373903 RepID=RL5_HALOH|nr:50S ribosomal protein L5 [Halothermothrix orenii]B8D0D6.1 RecName: Full=Large ribosomal subunit protein uL5; AltName: Full=50S ribosomal protein L5 [Halothermothrix orenii H 168]ACL68890.1 ribosomal protein L5 [Halothermothrix orenii H 168]